MEARKLKVPKHQHHHHHHMKVVGNGGKTIQRHFEQILALRGIKNSGPSPGEGHSAVNGAHN